MPVGSNLGWEELTCWKSIRSEGIHRLNSVWPTEHAKRKSAKERPFCGKMFHSERLFHSFVHSHLRIQPYLVTFTKHVSAFSTTQIRFTSISGAVLAGAHFSVAYGTSGSMLKPFFCSEGEQQITWAFGWHFLPAMRTGVVSHDVGQATSLRVIIPNFLITDSA